MTDKDKIRDILTNIAIDKNLKEPSNIGYHGTGARFFQYDPSYAYTGEGAQKYGAGFYSGGNPEIGEFYKDLANTQGKQGTVYQVNLPEQYKYYNTDLPLNQQSQWVQERLKGLQAKPLTIQEFSNQLTHTDRFNNLYNDFISETSKQPKYTSELLEFVNRNPSRYQEQVFNPMSQSSSDYKRLETVLKEAGIPGTTHYKPNGSNINITFDPKDIDIIQPYEIGTRTIANSTNVNKSLAEMLQGYKRAFNPTNRVILNNPYLRPAIRTLGATGRVLGPVGDTVMIYEAGKVAKQKMVEDYNKLSPLQKQLIGNHIGMNPKAGQGLNLPFIQVNNDGSSNVTLQGRVNYDDYYIEPLGDDIYIRRKRTN